MIADTIQPQVFRLMLLCSSDATVERLLHNVFAQEVSDLYGQLELTVVLVLAEPAVEPLALKLPAGHKISVNFRYLYYRRHEYQFCLDAAAINAISLLAADCDWLMFVNAASRNEATTDLLLLIAEQLKEMSSVSTAFVLCDDSQPVNSWTDFYQQLDWNSRWQKVADIQFVLKAAKAQPFADKHPQFEQCCSLLLLTSLPCVFRSSLPLWFEAQSVKSLQAEGCYQDVTVLMMPRLAQDTAELLQSLDAAAFNADTEMLLLSVVQQASPEMPFPAKPLPVFPSSHHQLYQQLILVQECQPELQSTMLLLRRSQPKPRWRLRGYWKLNLISFEQKPQECT